MSEFIIKGKVGDAFIRISADKEVQLIFGEDDESLVREVSWDTHEIYKCAVQFSLMIDSYLRNAKALDDLIVTSPTGSIPAELMGRDLLPILLSGGERSELEIEEIDYEKSESKPTYTNNVIKGNFKNKDKDNEDK
jgi:hypothetical protein|tara:strand:+ start:361 stop:768 length:408 start_codon:yes stop_codon:yes gene_type:complete